MKKILNFKKINFSCSTFNLIKNDLIKSLNEKKIDNSKLDKMNHLNVRYYMNFFDDSAYNLLDLIKMNDDYINNNNKGMMVLTHYIKYLNEIKENDKIECYTRLIGISKSKKRIHLMTYLLNNSNQNIASTCESIKSHVDLKIRKTSPFPEDIHEILNNYLIKHENLNWKDNLNLKLD
jgi:acyl-CoA thioester hydrolase